MVGSGGAGLSLSQNQQMPARALRQFFEGRVAIVEVWSESTNARKGIKTFRGPRINLRVLVSESTNARKGIKTYLHQSSSNR